MDNNQQKDNGEPPSAPKVNFHVMDKSVNDENFNRLFRGYGGNGAYLLRTEPGGFVVGCQYEANADKIYNLNLKADDTWVITFPKSGTTWMQEIVWLLQNNCDTKTARQEKQCSRSPFIEHNYMWAKQRDFEFFAKKYVDTLKSPRVLKSHLPFYLLPPQLIDTCKVIYVARNPKDVIVSYYHHYRLGGKTSPYGFNGDVNEFAQYFIDDEVLLAPYFPHVLDAWSKRNHPNFLFIFYEDMKKDFRGEISKVSAFLNKPVTDEQLVTLLEHLNFDNFRENTSIFEPKEEYVGHFIRKGIVGDWKNHFNGEMNEKIDIWIKKNLDGTDLQFVTELE